MSKREIINKLVEAEEIWGVIVVCNDKVCFEEWFEEGKVPAEFVSFFLDIASVFVTKFEAMGIEVDLESYSVIRFANFMLFSAVFENSIIVFFCAPEASVGLVKKYYKEVREKLLNTALAEYKSKKNEEELIKEEVEEVKESYIEIDDIEEKNGNKISANVLDEIEKKLSYLEEKYGDRNLILLRLAVRSGIPRKKLNDLRTLSEEELFQLGSAIDSVYKI